MADMEALVVLNAGHNQLTGSLDDYAFQSSNERNDVNSALRYLDFGGNTLSGAPACMCVCGWVGVWGCVGRERGCVGR